MHKNSQRSKIIHGIRPMGAKIDRSIWICVFVEISCLHNFCGSSYFFSPLLCFKIEELYFDFSILCNTECWSDVESVFRLTVWLYKGPNIFNFGLAMSYGCASKAMDLPFRTNRKRAQTCDRGPGIDTQLVAEYVQGPLYSSTIQVNDQCFGRVFSSCRILGNPSLLGNLFNFCNFQHFPTVPTKFFKQS